MDKINFNGGFLLHRPTPKKWEKIYDNIVPNKRVIINDLYEQGNVFFAAKTVYDSPILKYLLDQNVKFTFFPNINLTTRLDSYFPEKAVETLDAEKVVLSKLSEIRAYLNSITRKPLIPTKYRWKENDQVLQTMKALKFNSDDYRVVTENSVTTIYDKNGNIAAKASPNTHKGMNYVLVYPRFSDDKLQMLVVNNKGETVSRTTNIDKLGEFKEKFIKAVKIDKGRKRPTKKS